MPNTDCPTSTPRFDWIVASLSAWIIGGLYLDGWAHSHGRVDDVFFTPWHAVLYSGVLALFIFLFLNQARNVFKGYPLRRSLPQGYLLSLIGLGLFLLGGALDFVWHSLFGVEFDIEALLSPTHLLLATSGVFMVSGPIRAIWARRLSGEATSGWPALGPLVLSMTLVLSILTFFTQFANPLAYQLIEGSASIDQGQFGDIYLMNFDGTGQRRLTAIPEMDSWGGTWSPDGRQIVFTQREIKEEGNNGESALYLMDSDGSGINQLTDMPGREYLPTWSPDGTRIAFVSQAKQVQDIYVINSDGSNLQQLTDTIAGEFSPSWSPDGTRIMYAANSNDSSQLYVMSFADALQSTDGSQPIQLTSLGEFNGGAAWSPDGQQIVFHSGRSDNTDIYVINSDGSGEKRLTDSPADDYSPTWSPDGRQIAFVSWNEDQTDIYVMEVAAFGLQGTDGSNTRNLTHNHALEINFPKWSPDGKTIMFSANGHTTLGDPYTSNGHAIVSILFQSALLIGVVLILITHWSLPFGALTLLFTLNGALVSVFEDQYVLILPMLTTGLIADSLLVWLKPSIERRGRLWLFAFSIPALLYALYFLALRLTQGLEWTIHLWLGTIFLAGMIGLFIGFLIAPPLRATRES